VIAFYACVEHTNIHRAVVMTGHLAVPQAVCGRDLPCDGMRLLPALPPIDDPRQVCPDCFPSFVNHAAWQWYREVTVIEDD
jgi:hypothetical protein